MIRIIKRIKEIKNSEEENKIIRDYLTIRDQSHFFTLGGVIIKKKSYVTGKVYEGEEAWYIPNMLQNYKYMNSGEAQDELLDIICSGDNKLIFVWSKSEIMNDLYDRWCKREL